MKIVEKERTIKDGELVRLELEVPFVPSGRIVITPSDLTLTRDEGKTKVVIHQYSCNITKGLGKNHDPEDLHDIPWKGIGIRLDPNKDIILVGRQNQPWTVSLTHINRTTKLPPENI